MCSPPVCCVQDKYTAEDDSIILEDEHGRVNVTLAGGPEAVGALVTGLVVGMRSVDVISFRVGSCWKVSPIEMMMMMIFFLFTYLFLPPATVGFVGTPNDDGIFEAEEVVLAGLAPQRPLPAAAADNDDNTFIAIASGISIGSDDTAGLATQLLLDYVRRH